MQRYQYVQPASPGFSPPQRHSPPNGSINSSQRTLNKFNNNTNTNRQSIISGERYPGTQSSIDDETLAASSSRSKLLGDKGAGKTDSIGSLYSDFARNDLAIEDDDNYDDYGHSHGYREKSSRGISLRGCLNVTTLLIITLGLLMLFAGYPILEHYRKHEASKLGAFNIGGTNGTGQVPTIHSRLSLVDKDTPRNARRWTSPISGERFHLVFSDEFEEEGRTFWPGDDPFWEGVNIWYGATADYEWYTPEQINTTGGALQLTMEAKPMNNLNFRSGMLQSWNKFCFTGGYIEFAAILPGAPTEVGWWPGLWLQGNLARPGYLGTTDGMWPYSYNSCDSGILPNQTAPGRRGYSTVTGYEYDDGKVGLNWNNGMRTPSCTCSGEDHPGPNNKVGRSAPELDILEAQIRAKSVGQASQSLQAAPFDPGHNWRTNLSEIYDSSVTTYNSFTGNVYQSTISGVSTIPDTAYLKTGNRFTTFALEYTPDFTERGRGSITWYIDGKAMWTMSESSIGPRPEIDMGQRLIPLEALSIVMNFGISRGFQADLDFDTLRFPATMKVDYVRVYQLDSGPDRVSCSPPDYPTSEYIERHKEVYMNANYTTWPKAWPKNSLVDGC